MDAPVDLLTTEKLNDKAYAAIREKIITHELKPGTRLIDSQLAEKYGISRTPVRDAIRKLAEEGLVVPSGRKGYAVFKPTRQDIIEIYELRLILDHAVIRKLITQVLPSNYAYYMKVLGAIETELRSNAEGDAAHFPLYDEQFHDSLIRLVNNSRITSIYDDNRAQCKGFRRKTALDDQRRAKANQMHFRLLEAIKNLDLEQALAAAEAHIDMSRKDAIADLEQWEERSSAQ